MFTLNVSMIKNNTQKKNKRLITNQAEMAVYMTRKLFLIFKNFLEVVRKNTVEKLENDIVKDFHEKEIQMNNTKSTKSKK